MGELEQELVSYGIIEGYERAFLQQKETINVAIDLIESGKAKSVSDIINYFISDIHNKGEYLLEMKEYLLELEEDEPTELESAVVALVGAISQILH